MNEFMHFKDNIGTYGDKCAEVVNEYLRNGYSADAAQSEVEVFGKTYKILKREHVTAFYDEAGNTLFDVTNDRLEKEYNYLMEQQEVPAAEEDSGDDEAEESVEESKAADETETDGSSSAEAEQPETAPEAALETEPQKAGADEAIAKLQGELEKDKDKGFAAPVIAYLTDRCRESESLAADICQPHKTWEKCRDYIYSLARKQATGNYAAVRDDTVYEWAEDYYHLDDKAAEEKKAREEAERKKKAAERKQLPSQKAGTYKEKAKTEKKSEKKEPESKPDKQKKNSKDMDGQMDLFSMMGM